MPIHDPSTLRRLAARMLKTRAERLRFLEQRMNWYRAGCEALEDVDAYRRQQLEQDAADDIELALTMLREPDDTVVDTVTNAVDEWVRAGGGTYEELQAIVEKALRGATG